MQRGESKGRSVAGRPGCCRATCLLAGRGTVHLISYCLQPTAYWPAWCCCYYTTSSIERRRTSVSPDGRQAHIKRGSSEPAASEWRAPGDLSTTTVARDRIPAAEQSTGHSHGSRPDGRTETNKQLFCYQYGLLVCACHVLLWAPVRNTHTHSMYVCMHRAATPLLLVHSPNASVRLSLAPIKQERDRQTPAQAQREAPTAMDRQRQTDRDTANN
jgi:hypothetical protein